MPKLQSRRLLSGERPLTRNHVDGSVDDERERRRSERKKRRLFPLPVSKHGHIPVFLLYSRVIGGRQE